MAAERTTMLQPALARLPGSVPQASKRQALANYSWPRAAPGAHATPLIVDWPRHAGRHPDGRGLELDARP